LPFTLDPIPLDVIEKSITTLNQARLAKKQVFIMGEDGSHLLASFFACDLAKDKETDGWVVFQLGWTPEESELHGGTREHLPYRQVFIREFSSIVRPQDVLIIVSPDGNRPKTLHALQLAKRAGARSLAFTGLERGRLGLQAEINLHIPSETEDQFEDGVLILEYIINKALRAMNGRGQPEGGSLSDDKKESQLMALSTFERETSIDVNLSNRAKTVFEALYALSQELNQTVSRDQLIRRVLEVSVRVLGASSGSLVLYNEKGNACLAALAYEGKVDIYPFEHLMDILQRGLAGWVVQHRQPVLVTNTRNDRRWLRRSWEERDASRSAISTPLMSGKDVFGVLTLAHSEEDRFKEDDLILLGAIAVNVATLGGAILRMQNEKGQLE
jgi:phosphoheptose isomerase/putative methionine-R-sulfoxide reductase with GAF domain